MRTTICLTIILMACDAETVDDRDFGPAPSPSTCLKIEEVLYLPVSGPSAGWQWINIANRCGTSIKLTNTEVRWTKPGQGWVTKMALSSLGTLPAWGCLTVGGPKSGTANASPEYDLVKAFSPPITDPVPLGTAGVGLFLATSKIPFAGVIFGAENLEAILGVGGDTDLSTDIVGAKPGHSMRLYADHWIDATFPEPEHCGLY
jgi:hypothetical protein